MVAANCYKYVVTHYQSRCWVSVGSFCEVRHPFKFIFPNRNIYEQTNATPVTQDRTQTSGFMRKQMPRQ